MKTEKLQFNLPAELIAQQPLAVRSDSRLLILSRSDGSIQDGIFEKIGDFLSPGDCLVLNDTKVIPARFFGKRNTGAKLEGLFLSSDTELTWIVQLKGLRKIKTAEKIILKDKHKKDFCLAELIEKNEDGLCKLKLIIQSDTETILENIGFPPLPPYIKRDDNYQIAKIDKNRYQTIYADKTGAIAAPTAGLHFTVELIEKLKKTGISFANVTLHVGAGTYKPVTSEILEDHEIHSEYFSIDEKNAGIINDAKNKGGRIIPVGTTSTRVLESIASNSRVQAANGSTKLFITPGYQFKITDAIITNFHLPKSTLLALVAAFAGLDNILTAYKHAVQQRYRFYSYGDAMLLI
ncbi:tRNA preQ1(34) S-adenosylmethionine ribosyltransferase-isomerase QueA [Planctomycetota bacterium]